MIENILDVTKTEMPDPEVIEESQGVIKFVLKNPATLLRSESVVIPMRSYHNERWHTLCVSSQMGCSRGCSFCATGKLNLKGNLSTGDIVQQLASADSILMQKEELGGIRNIVFMGMGEPFDNWSAVREAIGIFNKKYSFPCSSITVSTSGHIDGIHHFAEEGPRGTGLAVSLNSANNELRSELMPINKIWPLEELHEALKLVPISSRRKFLVEYVMLEGINDSITHADEVIKWCKGLPCIVNLIKFNSIEGSKFKPSKDEAIIAFQEHIRANKVFCKIRRSFGSEISAACGQLGGEAIKQKR